MKKILIPIDFSNCSLNALSYAIELFKYYQSTFYLLNIYVSSPPNLLSENYEEDWLDYMDEESKEQLDEILNEVKKNNKNSNHNFKTISKSNSIINAINGIVASKNIDVVVMGSKGAKGGKEVFLGSNAVRVINNIDDCPVIVVPQNYLVKAPSQIVFSTNFKRDFNKNELNLLLDISQQLSVKLKIVQVMMEEYLNDSQKTNKEKLIELMTGLDFFFHKIDITLSESTSIKDFVRQTKSDMISFVNHKQNFFQKLTQENVITKISFDSPVPILVLPDLS